VGQESNGIVGDGGRWWEIILHIFHLANPHVQKESGSLVAVLQIFSKKNNFVREGRMLRVDIAGIDSSNC